MAIRDAFQHLKIKLAPFLRPTVYSGVGCVCVQLANKALSLSQFGSELWIGDNAGHVSLMDASAEHYKLVEVRLYLLLLLLSTSFLCVTLGWSGFPKHEVL